MVRETHEITAIPLKDCTPEWQLEWDKLMRDAWLRRKVDRFRRMADLRRWVMERMPSLMRGGGRLLDLGPGPGELLELAQSWGNTAKGVDAASGDGGMGDAYMRAARMMTERQGLDVEYVGVANWIEWLETTGEPPQYTHIVSRGSIEQIFSDYMIGDPHDQHHDCKRLRWDWVCEDAVRTMLGELWMVATPGAQFFIHANGAANTEWYDDMICRVASRAGWQVDRRNEREHNLIKPEM